MTHYYYAQNEKLAYTTRLPTDARPFEQAMPRVLPPQISDLHNSLALWAKFEVSPGVIVPHRIWIDQAGSLIFGFAAGTAPKPLMQTGLAAEIATWLVLLDCWMETFVVIARARSVWTTDELVGALTFLTPAFLPVALIQIAPQWARVAQAVALAVADGPLAGSPNDTHWQSTNPKSNTQNVRGKYSDVKGSGTHQPEQRNPFQRKSG